MAIALSEKRFRFVLRNLMYLRNFEGIVRALADRGYKIYITTSPKDRKVPAELRELARALEERYPQGVSFGITYERDDWWAPASRFTRNIGNLLHYRRRHYADCPGACRARRAARRTFGAVRLAAFLEPLSVGSWGA